MNSIRFQIIKKILNYTFKNKFYNELQLSILLCISHKLNFFILKNEIKYLDSSIFNFINTSNNLNKNSYNNVFNYLINSSKFYNIYLNNLIYLQCSNCNIKSISSDLIHLKTLICDNNPIDYLSPNYNKIELLNISNTNITYISNAYIELKYLYIDGNNIIYIPNFKKLKILFCNYSNILEIKQNNIRYLNCEHTFITTLNTNTILNLEVLICNNTLIQFDNLNNDFKDSDLNSDLNNDFKNKNFNLPYFSSYFQPKILPNFISNYLNNSINYSNIIYLNISNTNIIYIPDIFNRLIFLNISNTVIEDLPYNILNLEILIAKYTILKKISKRLVNLKSLDLSYNKIINKIPKLINLRYLNISNTNNILYLPSDLYSIKFINCSNSNILNINNLLILILHTSLHTLLNNNYSNNSTNLNSTNLNSNKINKEFKSLYLNLINTSNLNINDNLLEILNKKIKYFYSN
jgi:hypothetical protein